MIEDDNEKIRRNLVFASSLIIILFWLGVGENILIEKLIGNQIVLTNWKVSTLLIAILVYLSLRYRFAETTQKDFGRLLGEWNAILSANVDRRIRHLFKNFTKTQRDTEVFTPKLSAYVNDQITDTAFGEGKNWKLFLLEQTSIHPKDNWSGELKMAIELRSSDGYISKRAGGNSIEYSLNGYGRYFILTVSSLRLAAYTKGAIDFIAPILLAIIAFLILIARLIRDISVC